MSPENILIKNISNSINAKNALLNDKVLIGTFGDAANMVLKKYQSGGRLYIAGNGGSAADAQHLAAEFVSKLSKDRDPLPAEALTVDTSVLTAIGNDYGYSEIFSRQIRAKLSSVDVFLGITTSGQSPNIIKAIETCNSMGITSVVFTGRDGGKVAKMTDFCITAPGEATSSIQESHIVLAHALCEYVESSIFG